MRTHSAVIAVLFFGFALSGGCASHEMGTKLDPIKVGSIKKGVTTRSEIEQMFGPPMNISMMGDGRRMMMYHYTETDTHVKGATFIPIAGAFMGGSEAKTHNQQLQVMLTKADVVEDYVMNDGTQNIDVSNGFGRSSVSSTPAH